MYQFLQVWKGTQSFPCQKEGRKQVRRCTKVSCVPARRMTLPTGLSVLNRRSRLGPGNLVRLVPLRVRGGEQEDSD